MSNSRYPWVVTRTTHRRALPPLEAKEYAAVETCGRCGYAPLGVRRRKKCPACFVRIDQ